MNNNTLQLFDITIKNEQNICNNIDIISATRNYSSINYQYKNFDKQTLKESKEEYKDVPEYEGHYQISNKGNVKSLKRNSERVLSPSIDKTKGYYRVNLYKNKKRKSLYIHQLVAMAFLQHIPSGHELIVDHIDNNKTNNRLDNLQIISSRENSSKDRWRYNPSSYYTGVSYSYGKNKWESRISVNGSSFHLGYFINEFMAHLEYRKALEYYYEYSNLSKFPFKTKRRGVYETYINQLAFVFSTFDN